MSDKPDYILDIDGLSQPSAADRPTETGGASLTGRPWLAVHWKCCRVYSRIYRNRTGDAYAGRCPSCGKAVKARVGPGGVDSRFFTAF